MDDARRAFDRVEVQMEKVRADLQAAVIAAVRDGLSKAEAARRAGYTREYVSRFVDEANVRDGWRPAAEA